MEAALIIPILMTVALGILEISRAFNVQACISSAAADAARKACRKNETNSTITTQIQDAIKSSYPSLSNGDISITYSVKKPDGTNRGDGVTLSAALSKDYITVQVTVPFNKVGYLKGKFLLNKNIRGHCAMRVL